MNYRDLIIKAHYISKGKNSIAYAFIVPALYCTKVYKRSVGFFSSGVLSTIAEGINALVKNGGRIQLIASPKLDKEDIEAINSGYTERSRVIHDIFSKEFIEEIDKFNNDDLVLLAKLIARGILDIQIAVTEDEDGIGMYHDKFGVLEDFDGNKVAFFGSANSSRSGYRNNYEKIRLAKSWISGQDEIVKDEEEEFESLWNQTHDYVRVFSYTESAKKHIFEIVKNKGLKIDDYNYSDIDEYNEHTGIKLRKYQEKAIESWVNNHYKGFFVMATGTGKTWTAIYATKEITEKEDVFLVICAPYKHLIKQWAEDIKKIYTQNEIILISSENTKWRDQLTDALMRARYSNAGTVIAISTIVSFHSNDFLRITSNINLKKFLIVDEAHRFTNRDPQIKQAYEYMLGLSATPSSRKNDEKGRELTDFFGGQVFYLPIEYAIKNQYLVHYRYYPIFVNSTADEESRFKAYSAKIAACWRNNICIDPEECAKQKRNRLRVIAMADAKVNQFDDIINNVKENNHVIVYCGDGKLFLNTSEERRHIQFVKEKLDEKGFRTSQFTAEENMKTRMELVESFNKGMIDCLVAIRCLDEGINIPSIKAALIMASNDDYREFVQRRGRILRTFTDPYSGKEKGIANIYDVIVLPNYDMDGWAKIELRRFYEYAKLADNAESLLEQLDQLLNDYQLRLEDISDVEEEDERELDE